MVVGDKQTFRRLWLSGALGNRPRVWTSVKQVQESNYNGTLSLRVHIPNSPLTMYNVPVSDLCKVMWDLYNRGIDTDQIWFNESAPDDRIILQGEYFHGVGRHGSFLNRYFNYSFFKGKMKPAMLQSREDGGLLDSSGVSTDILLQTLMTPNSWDEFQELRDQFPDHTIELGIYEDYVGVNERCNHLIWEVRQY